MKIIEKGTLPEEREWKAACTNCRTRFELLEKEGVVLQDPRDGPYIHCSCPVCNHACYGSLK